MSRKKFILAVAIAVLLMIGIFSRSMFSSMAEEVQTLPMDRYYTGILIEDGQSLWSIAKQYNQNSGMTTDEYVKELRSMNRLKDDTIHTGKYLTIVYFSAEE